MPFDLSFLLLAWLAGCGVSEQIDSGLAETADTGTTTTETGHDTGHDTGTPTCSADTGEPSDTGQSNPG